MRDPLYALRRRRHRLLFIAVGIGLVLSILLPCFVFPVLALGIPRVRFWFYRAFLGQAPCPTCGMLLPFEGSWRCGGCGFVQHRHVYEPCAKCGTLVNETICPRCQHGLLL